MWLNSNAQNLGEKIWIRARLFFFAKKDNIDACFELEKYKNPNEVEMLIMYPCSRHLSTYLEMSNNLGKHVYLAEIRTKLLVDIEKCTTRPNTLCVPSIIYHASSRCTGIND